MKKFNKDKRDEISKILVKWHMPTRQAAINEIMALFEEGNVVSDVSNNYLQVGQTVECGSCNPKYWATDSEFNYLQEALEFHRINLTEGFEKAIEYLQAITSK